MFEKRQQKRSSLFGSDGEDRGVSPVIGVILMVAITVILAAVIGAFVLGLGDDLGSSAAPTATLSASGEFDHDGDEWNNVEIEHTQGEDIAVNELRFVFREDGDNLGAVDGHELDDLSFDGDFSVGDTIELDDEDIDVDNVDDDGSPITVDIVHSPSGSQIGSGNLDNINTD